MNRNSRTTDNARLAALLVGCPCLCLLIAVLACDFAMGNRCDTISGSWNCKVRGDEIRPPQRVFGENTRLRFREDKTEAQGAWDSEESAAWRNPHTATGDYSLGLGRFFKTLPEFDTPGSDNITSCLIGKGASPNAKSLCGSTENTCENALRIQVIDTRILILNGKISEQDEKNRMYEALRDDSPGVITSMLVESGQSLLAAYKEQKGMLEQDKSHGQNCLTTP